MHVLEPGVELLFGWGWGAIMHDLEPGVEPIILRFKRRGRWSGSMRVRGTRFQKSKKVKWQKSERRCVIRAFPPWLQAPPTPPLEFSEFRQRGCWVYRLD